MNAHETQSDATDVDYRERGRDVLRRIGWGHMAERPGHPDADQEFWDHTVENLFGRVLGRPGLSLRERELIVMAVIITQGSEAGIVNHFRNCHVLGFTERDVRELIYTTMYYAGWPKGSAAFQTFNKILNEPSSTWPRVQRIEPALQRGFDPTYRPQGGDANDVTK